MDRVPSPLRLSWLAIATLVVPATAAATGGGDNEPATPVPRCRHGETGADIGCGQTGAVRLWPPRFRPTLPGQTLDLKRDSTQWRSFTQAGAKLGHELFQSVAAEGDHLYVAYNAGISIWSIEGAEAEDPRRLLYRDGWSDHFAEFPPYGEQDFYVYDIAATTDPTDANEVLMAVAGEEGVGTTLWRHTLDPRALTQLYQDSERGSRGIRTVVHGGRAYAVLSGTFDALAILDLSAAAPRTDPCLDDAACPGIRIGEVASGPEGLALDAVVFRGDVFVAHAPTSGTPSAALWKLTDMGDPAGAAMPLSFDGDRTVAIALSVVDDRLYLAATRRSPARDYAPHLYDITACATAASCALPAPVWVGPSISLGSSWYLRASTSVETPMLYSGVHSNALSGTRLEGLYDLSEVASGNVTELTDGGATYTDPCSGDVVDYWGDYYARNAHGLRNFRPRVGVFAGRHFYRAAFGILDVHEWDGPVPTMGGTTDGGGQDDGETGTAASSSSGAMSATAGATHDGGSDRGDGESTGVASSTTTVASAGSGAGESHGTDEGRDAFGTDEASGDGVSGPHGSGPLDRGGLADEGCGCAHRRPSDGRFNTGLAMMAVAASRRRRRHHRG